MDGRGGVGSCRLFFIGDCVGNLCENISKVCAYWFIIFMHTCASVIVII